MILTTATAFNFVPQSISDSFFSNLLDVYKIPYMINSGILIVNCQQEMPSVHFLLSSYWVEIHSRDMLIDISPKRDGSLCACRFVPSKDEVWVLGQSLYKDYYMTHNPAMKTITFTPTEKKLKKPVQMGTMPTTLFQKNFNWIALGLKVLGMALMAIGTYGLVQLISSDPSIALLGAKPEEYKSKR